MAANIEPGAPGSLRGIDAEYPGYRRAGIRLSEPAHPDMETALRGWHDYNSFALGLQMFDKAHTTMLAEEGIIPRDGAAACLRALLAMEEQGLEDVRAQHGGGMHAGEIYLIRHLGMEVGGLIHAGRSSWDLTRVAHRIVLREQILEVMEALCAYREAILALASQNVDSVMPYYTHGQQAQPTTFAHHLHGFACATERDFERLELAFQHMNISPAGAAAGTTTRFRTNRERVAQLLGFDRVSTNSRDSSYNYDHLWEMGAALGNLANSMGFLADEFLLWMGNEFDLIQMADRYCGTSSIMTQKRNPSAAEYVQIGLRPRVAGRLPTTYSAPELLSVSREVTKALHLMAGVVGTTKVKKENMRATAANSWAQAADLAAVIVEAKGLPWRMAHQIVGIMVRLAEEEGISPLQATPALLDRAAVLFLGEPLGLSAERMAQALDPVACIAARSVTGSPSAAQMTRQIANSQAILAEDRAKISARRRRLAEAERDLADAIKAIVG